MDNFPNEEQDFTSAAERHHQIMMDGNKFFRRIAWGCGGGIVIIVGTVIFFLFKYQSFWRYP